MHFSHPLVWYPILLLQQYKIVLTASGSSIRIKIYEKYIHGVWWNPLSTNLALNLETLLFRLYFTLNTHLQLMTLRCSLWGNKSQVSFIIRALNSSYIAWFHSRLLKASTIENGNICYVCFWFEYPIAFELVIIGWHDCLRKGFCDGDWACSVFGMLVFWGEYSVCICGEWIESWSSCC